MPGTELVRLTANEIANHSIIRMNGPSGGQAVEKQTDSLVTPVNTGIAAAPDARASSGGPSGLIREMDERTGVGEGASLLAPDSLPLRRRSR
ncbi:hypothetical protein AAFF_G00423600 [Aldrovandia affinis]|uniref:Uncharacterized protein n=1 Tax=Aldrovandia affinis TaxID=143900 RepID=A0AAD7X037_9TELE|nr:hypothetical protein AAFF_G00423600 [Aldrovandia affinis]